MAVLEALQHRCLSLSLCFFLYDRLPRHPFCFTGKCDYSLMRSVNCSRNGATFPAMFADVNSDTIFIRFTITVGRAELAKQLSVQKKRSRVQAAFILHNFFKEHPPKHYIYIGETWSVLNVYSTFREELMFFFKIKHHYFFLWITGISIVGPGVLPPCLLAGNSRKVESRNK